MRARLFTYANRSGFVLRVILVTLLVCCLMAVPAFAEGTGNAGDTNGGTLLAETTTPEETTMEETTLQETTLQETTLQETTSEETTLPETTLQKTIPEGTTPAKTIPEGTTPGKTIPEATTAEGTIPEGKKMGPGETGKHNIVPGSKAKVPLPNTGGIPLSGLALGFVSMALGILSAVAIVRRGR